MWFIKRLKKWVKGTKGPGPPCLLFSLLIVISIFMKIKEVILPLSIERTRVPDSEVLMLSYLLNTLFDYVYYYVIPVMLQVYFM